MTRYEALRLIGHTLADTTGTDAGLDARWRAAAPHWPILLEAATEQRVGAALHTALRGRSVVPELPEDFVETLDVLSQLCAARNAEVRGQATAIARVLNGIGVTPLFLKGAGLLLAGLYPSPGDRLMADVDVLVAPADYPAAVDALRASGYRVKRPDLLHEDGTSRVDVHYPPMEHDDWPLMLEVHWAILAPPLDAQLPVAAVLARATHVTLDVDAVAAVPALEDALVHTVLHAEDRHDLTLAQDARLWQLWDALLLSQRMDEAEQARVLARLSAPACSRYLHHHAGVVRVFLGAPLFTAGGAALGGAGTFRLRHRYNQTTLGRLDAALGRALVAARLELRGLRLQWRSPVRRSAMLQKFRRPQSYARRLRNVFLRARGMRQD